MEEVRMFGTFEEMLDAIEEGTQAAISRMTDAQKALCDGNEHFTFYLDAADGSLAVVRVRSRQEILDGEYPEEVDLWFDDDGRASRGYLPCHTWDSEYYVWPDKPDLHDRHASVLMEITKDEFEFMRDSKCLIGLLLCVQHYVDLLNRYVDLVHEQARRSTHDGA